MEFLTEFKPGDKILIKSVFENGKTEFYDDIVLRKLKTKIETKTGDFSTKDGNMIGNNVDERCIVKFSGEIENQILCQRYIDLLYEMMNITFKDNDTFKDYINKVENIYNANKK